METKKLEQTLVLIKPDALKNSLTGYVLSQLSEFHTGLRFAGAKIVHVNRILAEEHYDEHRGKPFYSALLDYIMGLSHYPQEPWKQRVIAFVYQGQDAIRKIRDIAGPTDPHEARETRPGCIRALGTIVSIKNEQGEEIGRRMDNLIHASALEHEAEREIKLWFRPNDIPPYMHAYPTKLSDAYYFYNGTTLHMNQEPGSICFLSPGDVVWKSDMETIQLLRQGVSAKNSLESIIAKYLINDERQKHIQQR